MRPRLLFWPLGSATRVAFTAWPAASRRVFGRSTLETDALRDATGEVKRGARENRDAGAAAVRLSHGRARKCASSARTVI